MIDISKLKTTKRSIDQQVDVLLYGQAGVGKTHFLGTCPKPLIIDTNGGLMTLHEKDIPVLEFEMPTIKNRKPIYSQVSTLLTQAKANKGDFQNIETICIDDLSTLADMLLAEAMLSPGPGAMPVDPTAPGVKPGYEAYNYVLTALTSIILLGKSCGKNFVCTAGVKIDTDEVSQMTISQPLLVGSSRSKVPYMFDEYYYMTTESKQDAASYVLYTQSFRLFRCKSRTKRPSKVIDPSFDKLFRSSVGKEGTKS